MEIGTLAEVRSPPPFLCRACLFTLPTSCFLLPASYFLLPASYFLLPTSYFLRLTTNGPLLTTHYLSTTYTKVRSSFAERRFEEGFLDAETK